MKGYCVDVRGFSLSKKQAVIDAICYMIGDSRDDIRSSPEMGKIGNVFIFGDISNRVVWGTVGMSQIQSKYRISFDDLMIEAGFNYVEDGTKGFKEKSLAEAEKELEKTDSLIESLGVESNIISDLESEIKELHSQLIVKHIEVGRLNAINNEFRVRLEWKDRKYGLVAFVLSLLLASQVLINFLGE